MSETKKKPIRKKNKKKPVAEILLVISVLIMGILVVLFVYKGKTNKLKNASRTLSGDYPMPSELIPSDKRLYFAYMDIPDMIFEKMKGKSFKEDCPVKRTDLRYLQVLYWGTDNQPHKGELIVNVKIADKAVDIFYELYKAKYPIESIKLVDEFGGNDEVSMGKNNTSCFNARKVEGSNEWSMHAYGLAIDINPLYNPCVFEDGTYLPVIAEAYIDRNKAFQMKIDENDFGYTTFVNNGFEWGGSWEKTKDYQHFEFVTE